MNPDRKNYRSQSNKSSQSKKKEHSNIFRPQILVDIIALLIALSRLLTEILKHLT